MRDPAKKSVIAVAIAVAAALLCLGGALVFTTDFSFRRQAFVADSWRSGDARQRGSMVDDLLRKNLLSGRSSKEVVALLGPPDSTCDPWSKGRNFLTYQVFVGKKLGSSPWPHFLHLVLGPDHETVQEVYLAD